MHPVDGFRSLPGTPQTYFSFPSTNARNVWVTVRRDRRARLATILQGRSAKGQLPPDLETNDEDELAYSKDLARAIRLRAREVGWMFGIRTRPKLTYLSALANSLRSTLEDEDDVIGDAVQAADQEGVLQLGEQPVDFEDIQEIVALRNTFRHLLRLRLEHPDANTRKSIADLMGRINNERKNLRVPPPEPMGNGPSFFFPASRFSFAAILAAKGSPLGDEDDEDGSSSSDDDELLDYDDHSNSRTNFQSIGASRMGAGRSERQAHAAFIEWVSSYEETLSAQWPNGAPHLMQMLAPLPQSGHAMLDTLDNVFRLVRSGLREADAHYLFGAAAAQVGSLPLVYMAESRVLDTCYGDDGDTYEAAFTYGIQAATPRVQLLARFARMLESRPWEVSGSDIRALVDEYVVLHREHTMGVQSRPRGDSTGSHMASPLQMPMASPHLGPMRSNAATGAMSDVARRTIEEAAVRDLLHATVLAAVAHSLGCLASACGLAPDLDQRAGSYFTQTENLMAVEPAAGLDFVPSSGYEAAAAAMPSQIQTRLSAAFVETVERNTTEFIARATRSVYSHGPGSNGPPPATQSSSQPHRVPPPPPPSMLRTFTGAESRVNGFYRTLTHVVDPMSSPAPQFVAYRTMRARKLGKYHQSLGSPLSRSPLASERSIGVFPSIDQSLAGLNAMSLGQPMLPVQPRPPKSVHLSQREDLRWDVISDYLRQHLSINEDYLGVEVQTARNQSSRRVFETALDGTPGESGQISLYQYSVAPINPPTDKGHWTGSADYMDDKHAMDLKPKSYNIAGVLSVSNNGTNSTHAHSLASSNRSLDVRQFHDAIWHFTLSLFHIYEEYYFYNKFRGEMSPDASQDDEFDHDGAISIPVRSASSGACSPDRNVDMDVDGGSSSLGLGVFSTPTPNSNTSPHYQKWLTEELKAHIRAVVRHPSSVTGLSVQPAVATGLNLCIEEMIHINLIVSLAKRQAEIIHGIRAIREYEGLSSP
ncbi:hypothetical protein LPJ53_001658 [Coemansia erecta]|uniref:Uncharacterized protein n=1 Tax=Coemansia erecta TaxID=147472 RepID=A0A9W7XZK6_9FUNG|nr:hypothetical protein LPJ53_001658 [Coemansia erecta]